MVDDYSGSGCLGCSIVLLWLVFLFAGGALFLVPVQTEVDVPPDESAMQVGVTLTLSVPDGATDADIEMGIAVIEGRLEQVGALAAPVTRNTDGTLSVMVDGAAWASEQETITELLLMPGRLELVDFSGVPPEVINVGDLIATTGGDAADGQLNPPTGEAFPTLLANEQIASAEAVLNDVSARWLVAIEFTPEGADIVEAHTAQNIGEAIAIVSDGEVLSTPVVQVPLSDEAVITGNFTEAEARALALTMGAVLPFAPELLEIAESGE